ncbi:chromosome segregation protein SMC [Apilactobacillus ozensis DSM 23829 = JCM 17196]|uniref:Chromosome partition protein Smc n=1 Tax=Apilactobacillus ozensis DSM 23829 = JCM 17196 TaxID=1423781 RepID=A0A0R2ALK5_9LACO|nr:chromosome segregation protein SMC [Apilactobacillus ozensis]KRM68049.1 chromosome segregation protein SMC [Apilactobacillus ozensis DSM 23829 = JCM 17196]
MRLESLELIGFKSFAQKTEFNFHKGLTEIVGPNGSGKSNIIEAIRWVLGEKSAKSLRGEKMSDIIFSGSDGHHSLNRAIVKLTFDNSDRYIDIDYTELSISREIFKNGENNYYINGKLCRLKDINNLFMDSGIGQGSFSIISQGNVENIFNSKPEDRRYIVETLAGIYKYKNKKQETNAKLNENKNNLIRINDIILELKKQVESLQEQSKHASNYLELKKRLSLLDKKFLFAKHNEILANVKKSDLAISQLNLKIENLKQTINSTKSNIDNNQSALNVKASERYALQKQLLSLSKQKEIILGQNNLSQQEIKFSKEQIKKFNVTLTKNKKEKEQITKNIEIHSNDISNLNKLINKNNLQDMQQQLHSLDDEISILQQKRENLKNDYFKITNQITDSKNEYKYLTKDYQKTEQIISEKRKNLADMLAKHDKLSHLLSHDKDNLEKCESKVKVFNREITALNQLNSEIDSKINTTKDNWYNSIKVFQSKKSNLENLQANASHLKNIAKHLIKNNDLNGIIGIVADFINVDTKYVRAINNSLNNKMRNIIVENANSAKAAIDFLTKKKLGRTTFLPKDELKKHRVDSQTMSKIADVPGFVGMAADLVSMPKSLNLVKQYLLGNILIVNNVDSATKIGRIISYRYKIVTINGEIINTGGSITGGRVKHENNSLLDLKYKINNGEKEVSAAENKMLNYESSITNLNKDLKNNEKSIISHRELSNKISKKIITTKASIKNTNDLMQNLNRDVDATKLSIKRLNNDLKSKLRLSNNSKMHFYEDKLNSKDSAIKELNQKLSSITSKRKELYDSISNSKSDELIYREKIINHKEQQTQLIAQLKNIEQNILEVTSDRDELSKKISLSSNYNDEKLKKVVQEIELVNTNINECINDLNMLNHNLSDENAKLAKLNDLLFNNNINLNKLELNHNNLNNQLSKSKHILSVKYNLKLPIDDAEQIDLKLLELKIKNIKAELNQLGPVNIHSIQEYKNVLERFKFLKEQSNDLKVSRNQLKSTMSKIDKEVVIRFKNNFDELNESFSNVFREMFGGGKAKLLLTEPDNMLSTGIDIMVQPPGKKYRNINLLSGGEKSLAAIALLFAVLRVKAVPFCILDEAESFLDSSNVNCFAQYICKLKDKTQFIVITHRKETMMYADTLNGITMQKSGISKLVSVDFNSIANKKEK